tara:strand:- start:518 stop:922 length:405 start_codon:yes stop_codon:yes gene_type:complete
MSGIYLIFSNTIMPTLRNVQSGADVMAQLNDIILNSTFKFLFFFSAVSSAYLAMFASDVDYMFRTGCFIFFVGTFIVTLFRNVPLNNLLKEANRAQNRLADVWRQYLISWVRWNHVRAISSIVAITLTCLSSYN